MKQFVAWARVSSVQQRKEGFSLQDQEIRLAEFAHRLGGVVVKMYKVAETATRHQERDTFRDFTAYVRKHARSLSGVLFLRVDRASRNLHSWTELEALTEATGVPLLFPDQPSAETPAGRMSRRMSAVFASYATDQQSANIRAGQRRRIENGLPLACPFGYRFVRVNGRSLVEHDPLDAPKVKRIFDLYAFHQHTLDSLREALAAQGVVFTDRAPKFHKQTLHKILRNRHYIGEVGHQGQWYPGTFAPLIDRATFQAVQDRWTGKVYQKPQLTFAGRAITCGHCGHCFTGERKFKHCSDGSVRSYVYYFCTHYQQPGHPRIRLREEQVDRHFLELFGRMRVEDPDVRQWIVDVIRAKANGCQEQNRQHQAELERQRVQIEGKLKTLLDLRMEGEITAEEYASKRAELHERVSGVRLQLESCDKDDREVEDLAVKVFELAQSLKTRWESADCATKRTILDIVCESVLSNQENLHISTKKPFDLLSNGSLVNESGGKGTRTPDLIHAMDALYQN